MRYSATDGYTAEILPAVYKTLGIDVGDELPAYTTCGMYPIAYYDTEGNTLCAACANKTPEYSADTVACEALEGGVPEDYAEPITCDDCGRVILSADCAEATQ